jgi:PilZ domain
MAVAIFKSRERRNRHRVRYESPATVTAGQHSIAVSTKDISDRGLFFLTDARFELGSEIDLIVILRKEMGLAVSGMACCQGRVIRSEAGGGQYGVAVEINRLAPVQQV